MPETTNNSSDNSKQSNHRCGFFRKSNERLKEMQVLINEIGNDLNTIANNLMDSIDTKEKSLKDNISNKL